MHPSQDRGRAAQDRAQSRITPCVIPIALYNWLQRAESDAILQAVFFATIPPLTGTIE
jgi:hypothetical protein